jgi:hypothetical protein
MRRIRVCGEVDLDYLAETEQEADQQGESQRVIGGLGHRSSRWLEAMWLILWKKAPERPGLVCWKGGRVV